MAIIDSQISLVNTEFSGDIESVNKDTNNLFVDILKAVKGGHKPTGELSEKTLNAESEKSASQLNTIDSHDIAHVDLSLKQASSELEVSEKQTTTDNKNSDAAGQNNTDTQHSDSDIVEGNNSEGNNSERNNGELNINELATSHLTVYSQEKSANTLLNKLTESQAYTMSVNQSDTSTSTHSSTILPVQLAPQDSQPDQLNAHLVALKKDLTQLIEKQDDSDLTIEQIKPVIKKMQALIAHAATTNEQQKSRTTHSFSSLEQVNLNSQAKLDNDGKIKTAAFEIQSNNQLNATVFSTVSPKTAADTTHSASAPVLTPVLASFIKDDVKPLVTQLNQMIEYKQDKASIYQPMPHNGIEIANKEVEKSQVIAKVSPQVSSELSAQVSPKVKLLNNELAVSKDAENKVNSLSQSALPKTIKQSLNMPDTRLNVAVTEKTSIKNMVIAELPNEVPKVSKEDLKPLLKKIDALIEPAGNEIKQQKFSTVNNQLPNHDRLKTPAPLVQIDSADKQVVDKLNNNDVNLVPVKDESKPTSSAQAIKQEIKQEIKLDNNGHGIGRLQQANKERPIDSDELPADLITMTKNQQKQPQAVEQIAVNIAAPKQANNQPMVRDVGRIVNAEMAEKINQQDIDTATATEQIEQPISFSKLLGTMKNNASAPVLSQLMTQVQSSQSQQAEWIDFEHQQVTQQITQLARHSNQTPAATEQLVHNSINTARSEVTKALYNKANIMLNLNLKEAEVRLDPPELGAMQIRLRSDAEQAQINFIVQNQAAKEMLEQTMGKLKEMLAEQGIELGESSVSEQGNDSEQQSEQSSQEPSQEIATMVEKESQHLTNEQIVNNKQDGIDFYA